MENNKITFDISIASLVKIVLFLLFIWLLYAVRDILVLLLVVAIITITLEPFVEKLDKDGIPRSFSVIVLYLALLAVLGIAVYFIVPPVANQIKELTINLPYYSARVSEISIPSTFLNLLGDISSQLSQTASSVVTTLVSIFGGVMSAVVVFALTYYSLVDKEGVRRMITLIVPVEKKDRLYNTLQKISVKFGGWLRGQIVLMVTISLLDGLVLTALGIDYALTLAVLAGILEVIPVIGPIIATLFMVFVAFATGTAFWKILLAVALFILVQQLENHVLVPKIMQKTVGLSPIVVIIAILVGAKILGVGGAILAVPVTAGIQVFVSEYFPNFGKR